MVPFQRVSAILTLSNSLFEDLISVGVNVVVDSMKLKCLGGTACRASSEDPDIRSTAGLQTCDQWLSEIQKTQCQNSRLQAQNGVMIGILRRFSWILRIHTESKFSWKDCQ